MSRFLQMVSVYVGSFVVLALVSICLSDLLKQTFLIVLFDPGLFQQQYKMLK